MSPIAIENLKKEKEKKDTCILFKKRYYYLREIKVHIFYIKYICIGRYRRILLKWLLVF